jgi:hypothetical protein
MSEDTTESLKDAIRVDAEQLRGHIDEARYVQASRRA